MPQFFIPEGTKANDLIRLSPSEAHHLRDVLRLKLGETIHLTDGKGRRYQGEIRSLTKKEAAVLIRKELPPEVMKGILKIGQALLKREKMEFVVQKSVELGVASFHPFISSRTAVRLEGDKKIKRWQKIADEAAKQCERASRMILEAPVSFRTFVEKAKADIKIIFWEEGGEPVHKFFRRGVLHGTPTRTTLALIGPEGGFAAEEVEAAKDADFAVLSLGPRILRAETASLVVACLIQYELENF